MRIIAMDPGGATGLAFYQTGVDWFRSCEMQGFDDVARELQNCGADVFVVEGFKITARTHKLDQGAFEQTLDLIGACRAAALHSGAKFVRQYNTDKAFGTNDKLHKLGWWSVGSEGHDNDAARHLLKYLASVRYTPILQALTEDTP